MFFFNFSYISKNKRKGTTTMRVENWFNAKDDMPEYPGEYVVKKNGKEKVVFFLREGDKILLKGGGFSGNTPESKFLKALSKQSICVNISQTGFYSCRKDKSGKESLALMSRENMYWSSRKNNTLGYSERMKKLSHEYCVFSESEKEIDRKIWNYIRTDNNTDNNIKAIYDLLTETFSEETYPFCGVIYNVDPLIVKRAMAKALDYRRAINLLGNYHYTEKVALLAFEGFKNYPVKDSLNLKRGMYDYLIKSGIYFEDAKMITDAYFIKMFLPTKEDVIKAIYKEDNKDFFVSEKEGITKLFWKYRIMETIRDLGRVYGYTGVSKNELMENIAIFRLAESFALSMFPIKEYLDTYEKEMGVKIGA